MHHDKTGISFSLKNRISSIKYAFRGLVFFIKREHNAWIHLAVSIFVFFLAFLFRVSITELLFLIISIGFVFMAEAFNTALEVDMNLTSPGFHPFARDVKDIAAGGVLIASIVSFTVGCIIFLPKILDLLY